MMYEAKHYDNFWANIIKQMPRGGSYRFDQRREGYEKIMDLIPEGSKVFDYACGLALVSIRLAKEKACKVSGCDFSKVAVDYAKEKSGGDFKTTDKVFGDKYDFIILSHYLEHIENPVEFMNELYTHGKQIIVSLPNNFRHIGEHVNMQWSNWAEFDKLFKGFDYERIDNGYTTKTHHAWHHPIFLFKEKKMHPSYLDSSTGEKKVVAKKIVKKVAKKEKKKVEKKEYNAESKSNSY